MNGNVVEDDDQPSGRQKLKPGQKRMQNLAREALANSKLHRRLVQQRVQQGRWPGSISGLTSSRSSVGRRWCQSEEPHSGGSKFYSQSISGLELT